MQLKENENFTSKWMWNSVTEQAVFKSQNSWLYTDPFHDTSKAQMMQSRLGLHSFKGNLGRP